MQQNDNFKWLRKELEFAYKKARRGKTGKPQVEEFDKNLKKELDSLTQEIYSRKYTPRPSSAFIVNKPVKREIFAADFRDRVVHHFIFNQVNPWWDGSFNDQGDNGNVWSSSANHDNADNAFNAYFNSDEVYPGDNNNRNNGMAVR